MDPIFFGMGRESQEKGHIDIVIGLLYIGIGVVQYIVLDPPDGRVRPYEVHRIAQIPVHCPVPGIGAVYGIVHDAHSYPGHPQAAYDIEHEHGPDLCDKPCVQNYNGGQKKKEHQDGLPAHAIIGMPVGTAVLEMPFYPFSQRP